MARQRYIIKINGRFGRMGYQAHRTAHHEAGHAFIGRVLGLEGGSVTMVGDHDNAGCARFREGGTVEERIMLMMAGWQAEREIGFDNAENEIITGSAADRSEIGFIVLKSDYPINTERLRRKTRRLVKQHRDKISRVALALLEHGTLQADEIDALMR
jgi:hypothetical protein